VNLQPAEVGFVVVPEVEVLNPEERIPVPSVIPTRTVWNSIIEVFWGFGSVWFDFASVETTIARGGLS
jgi:hypothetical protein